jgi:hypothetical protein
MFPLVVVWVNSFGIFIDEVYVRGNNTACSIVCYNLPRIEEFSDAICAWMF